MDIDRFSDSISDGLRGCKIDFAAALRTANDSFAYASAIVSVTKNVLSIPEQWKLWIRRFGLLYGAFAIPSDLFPVPIRCRFGSNPWRKDPNPNSNPESSDPQDREPYTYLVPRDLEACSPDEWTLDDESNMLPNDSILPYCEGFFKPECLTKGAIHVQFVSALFECDRPLSHNRSVHTILVPEDFLEIGKKIGSAPWDFKRQKLVRDETVARFVHYNRNALKYLFNFEYPITIMDHFLAIRELQDFTSQHSHHAPHIYLFPGDEFELHPGAFCFAFQEEVSPFHKTLLGILSNRLFRFLRAQDHSEFQRRTTPVRNQIAAMNSELHSLRNVTGALGNKLHTFAARDLTGEQPSSSGRVTEALELHTHLLHHLDKIESLVSPTFQASASTVTLRILLNLWRAQWNQPETIFTVILPKEDHLYDNQFELSGPPDELGDALFQLIEGRVTDSLLGARDQEDLESMGFHLDSLSVTIAVFVSELELRIHGGRRLPSYVVRLIHELTLLDRLPSLKPSGGKGILSAIALIRTQFRATLELTHDPNWVNMWRVTIPIIALNQYRLFSEVSS
jgi:hypothetical protein